LSLCDSTSAALAGGRLLERWSDSAPEVRFVGKSNGLPILLERRLWPDSPVARANALERRHYNSSFMAAGDAQRVWFPEMIERLRSRWHQGMSCDALIELRDDLDAMLERIRSDRHIRPAVFRCPECGHVGVGAEPHVGVRAMILSRTRFGIAPAEQTRPLEKAWAAYRKQKGVDLYGVASIVSDVAGCDHPVSGKF